MGFTMVEVAVSSLAMVSLMLVFSLIPSYLAKIRQVETTQEANITASDYLNRFEGSLDPETESQGTYTITVNYEGDDEDGTELTGNTSPGIPNDLAGNIGRRLENKNVFLVLENYTPDILDVDSDSDEMNAIQHGSNPTFTTKLNSTVFWLRGNRCGSVHKEKNVYTRLLNYESGSVRQAWLRPLRCAGWNRWCYCNQVDATHVCDQNECRCQRIDENP